MVENSHPLQMANDAKIKKWFPNKAQIQGIAKKTWSKNETENVTIKPLIYISERFQATPRCAIRSGKRPLKKS